MCLTDSLDQPSREIILAIIRRKFDLKREVVNWEHRIDDLKNSIEYHDRSHELSSNFDSSAVVTCLIYAVV